MSYSIQRAVPYNPNYAVVVEQAQNEIQLELNRITEIETELNTIKQQQLILERKLVKLTAERRSSKDNISVQQYIINNRAAQSRVHISVLPRDVLTLIISMLPTNSKRILARVCVKMAILVYPFYKSIQIDRIGRLVFTAARFKNIIINIKNCDSTEDLIEYINAIIQRCDEHHVKFLNVKAHQLALIRATHVSLVDEKDKTYCLVDPSAVRLLEVGTMKACFIATTENVHLSYFDRSTVISYIGELIDGSQRTANIIVTAMPIILLNTRTFWEYCNQFYYTIGNVIHIMDCSATIPMSRKIARYQNVIRKKINVVVNNVQQFEALFHTTAECYTLFNVTTK